MKQSKQVYVIAEAGVNHNGSLDLAMQLVREAKIAGADAVKFQTFNADELVTRTAEKADYQLRNTSGCNTQYEMLKQLELSIEEFATLKRECQSVGIDFLSTPYNTTDVDALEKLDVNIYKIASAMAVEPAFLEYVAKTNKPIILSTGMCTHDEVANAVDVIKNNTTAQLTLLQCTTNYPSTIEDCNLAAMVKMADTFDVPVGYSDHTQSHTSAIVAVALGASVIEKHFTLDKSMDGPDHSSSCDPPELKEYITLIKQASECLGDACKAPTSNESINRPKMRRGVVAKTDLPAGTIVSHEHIAYKRPESDLKPGQVHLIIGKKLKLDLKKDDVLKLDFFN
ncbi:MAG: N-acetylneuraminate synthase [Gammaproteobacteria bacterium]